MDFLTDLVVKALQAPAAVTYALIFMVSVALIVRIAVRQAFYAIDVYNIIVLVIGGIIATLHFQLEPQIIFGIAMLPAVAQIGATVNHKNWADKSSAWTEREYVHNQVISAALIVSALVMFYARFLELLSVLPASAVVAFIAIAIGFSLVTFSSTRRTIQLANSIK